MLERKKHFQLFWPLVPLGLVLLSSYVLLLRGKLWNLYSNIMQPMVIVAMFYNGSEEEGRANFKSFLDLSKLYRSFDVAHL